MVRRQIRLALWWAWLLPFLIIVLACPAAQAWGQRGHRMVNAAAVANLPEPLRSSFRARFAYLTEHASDPDLLAREDSEERPHHYTEVEAYDAYPFARFKLQFVDDHRGPSQRQLEHGDSVWQIERFTLRLSQDLRRRRWSEADRDAVFAAHYACDLTQPLHTVMNYDGQFTRQAGIHARFETVLVNALADDWRLKPQPPINEPDLRARIFREYVESYNQRELIFAGDRIALDGHTYLDPQVQRAFNSIDGTLARRRLEAAAAFVSSLWYTAWVRAGKPDLANWEIEAGKSKTETRTSGNLRRDLPVGSGSVDVSRGESTSPRGGPKPPLRQSGHCPLVARLDRFPVSGF